MSSGESFAIPSGHTNFPATTEQTAFESRGWRCTRRWTFWAVVTPSNAAPKPAGVMGLTPGQADLRRRSLSETATDPPDGQTSDTAAWDRFDKDLTAWKEAIDANAGYRLDLRGVNLQGDDLSHAVRSGGRLDGARMEGAILDEARIEGVACENKSDGCTNHTCADAGREVFWNHLETALLAGAGLSNGGDFVCV